MSEFRMFGFGTGGEHLLWHGFGTCFVRITPPTRCAWFPSKAVSPTKRRVSGVHFISTRQTARKFEMMLKLQWGTGLLCSTRVALVSATYMAPRWLLPLIDRCLMVHFPAGSVGSLNGNTHLSNDLYVGGHHH